MSASQKKVKEDSVNALRFVAIVALLRSSTPQDRIKGARLIKGDLPSFEALLLRSAVVGERHPRVCHELMSAISRVGKAIKLTPANIMETLCDATAVLIGIDPAYNADPPEFPDIVLNAAEDFAGDPLPAVLDDHLLTRGVA